MAGRPGKITLKSDKKGVFAPAAHAVLYENRARVGGNDKYIVKLAADHFKAEGQTDLSVITADEMKDALAAIVARHQPAEGEDEGHVDVRTMIDDAAVDGWNAGEWRNQGRATDLIEFLVANGYSDQNRAPKPVVAKFFADSVAKLAKTEDGPEGSQCALGEKCTSAQAYRFTPVAQNIVLRDGKVLTHEKGDLAGKSIRTGQYMVSHQDQTVIGPVCQRDVSTLRRMDVKFYDKVGAERVVVGMQKREQANAGLAEIAGSAVRRRRPPVQESGSRKMPDSWSPRRNRGR